MAQNAEPTPPAPTNRIRMRSTVQARIPNQSRSVATESEVDACKR
jgi:hypothetical protein